MAENEFLKGIKASQNIKDGNEQLKKSLSSVMANSTKSFAISTKVQTQSLLQLKSIDKSISTLNKFFGGYVKKIESDSKRIATVKDITNNDVKYKLSDTDIKKLINVKKTKEFFEKDLDQGMRDNIADIEQLMIEQNEMEKKKKQEPKKTLFDHIFGVGKMLAVGGLLGYLLTGKGEFISKIRGGLVTGAVKAFTFMGDAVSDWYKGGGNIQILKAGIFMRDAILGGLKYSFVDNMAVGKMMVSALKLNKLFSIGGIAKSIKGLGDLGKIISGGVRFAKTIGKVLSNRGVKSAATVAMKAAGTASKTALKKIPVVGGLLGMWFGIQRFQKGDWVGGLMEVASGIVSIVPGVGTALSLGIDAILLFKDMKGDTMTNTVTKNAIPAAKSVGKYALRNVPILGSFLDIMDSIKLHKSGKHKESLKLMGRGIMGMFPGGGIAFDVLSSIGSLFGGNDKEAGDMMSGGGISASGILGADNTQNPNTANESYEKDLNAPKASSLLIKPGVDMNGVNLGKPFNVVSDSILNSYQKIMGKSYQPVVTSARRSAYENSKIGGKSTSKHLVGRALDLRTNDISVSQGQQIANALRSQLGNSYGVLQHGTGAQRHIHLQNNEGGDANFPQEKIEDKIKTNKIMQVALTQEDINKLAIAFGEQMQKNKSVSKAVYSTGQTSNVRSSY